jgi:hypothetical protein
MWTRAGSALVYDSYRRFRGGSVVGFCCFRWILESCQCAGLANGAPSLINGMLADLRSATVVARPDPSTEILECIDFELCLNMLEIRVHIDPVGVVCPVTPILGASGFIHDSSGCSLPRNAEKIREVISFSARACVQERPYGRGERVQNFVNNTLSSWRCNARV